MNKPVIWSILLFAFGLFGYVNSPQEESQSLEIVASSLPTPLPTSQSEPNTPKPQRMLPNTLDPILEDESGTFGVSIYNTKTGEAYGFDEHHVFEAASLYKLWVMGAIYDEIKNGNMHETDILSDTIPALNRKFSISPENAELTEGSITLSVSDALKRMITISDNYSALLLTAKIRLSAVAAYLERQGLSESKVGTTGGPPTTTASDIQKFFEKLYNGELAEEPYRQSMLTLLKNQQINHKLPAQLPEGITIAHKTGELGGFSHDAGIVYTPNGDYIVAVLTESNIPKNAEEEIAKLSQKIYQYFTQ